MIISLLSQEVFAHLWVFARVATALMMMIGIGDSYVSPRFRLTFALLLTLIIRPVIDVPVYPDSPMMIVILMAKEVCIGIFFGMIARIIISTVDVAGSIIGSQTGLGSAMLFNPAMLQQTGVLGVFMTLGAVTIIMLTDLHHLGIIALVNSYHVFAMKSQLMMGDMSQHLLQLSDDMMLIGVQMAAPLIVMGLIFNLGMGILARLMPQIQIYFVAVPLQIILGFITLILSLPVIMGVFAQSYENWYEDWI